MNELKPKGHGRRFYFQEAKMEISGVAQNGNQGDHRTDDDDETHSSFRVLRYNG